MSTPSNDPEFGRCDHVQPADVIEMAEKLLRSKGIPEPEWDGKKFGWGGEIDTQYWKSLYYACERRGKDWVIIGMNRSKENCPPEKVGFKEILE